MSKTLVYYHRAYRKITGSRWVFAVQFLLVTIPLSLLILLGYPELTKWMSNIARYILSSSFAPGSLQIVQQTFLLEDRDVFLLIAPNSYPSTLTSFISSVVMLLLIFIFQLSEKNKNLAVFAIFVALIHMVSSIFFTLVPYLFPYTFTDFTELYYKTVICIWLFIPFLLSMAILPLPAPFMPKFVIIILTLIYSFAFATLRWVIFLYVLAKFSFIYMALLFFILGPLIDFVYVVGIYAVYTTQLAKKLKGSESVWHWLY